MQKKKNKTAGDKNFKRIVLEAIHYYDTETGYIHYVSRFIKGLECRVYDAVRCAADIEINPAQALQFMPGTLDFEKDIEPMGFWLWSEACAESLMGPTFMDNIMRSSPLRDNNAWLTSPDGRARYLVEREGRLAKWRRQN
jgi:hypothetical protein